MSDRVTGLKWVLTDLVLDLVVPIEVFRERIRKEHFSPDNKMDAGVIRMSGNAIIISLSKLTEIFNAYGKEINELPNELKNKCAVIKREIESKKIYQFRSKYVAHIIDKDTKLPLSRNETKVRFENIMGKNIGDMETFCSWVCPIDYSDSTNDSVVKVITELRDHYIGIIGSCGVQP